MPPNLSNLELQNQSEAHFVHLISGLLTPKECIAIINQYERSLISTSGAYSTRLRHMFLNEDLAQQLWTRLKSLYGSKQIIDEENQVWTASHLNPFFRFCKYTPGDAFGPHIDGRRLMTIDQQSFMTVNLYLNTVPAAHGGATRILDRSTPGEEGEKYRVLGLMQPEAGTASVFRDSLFHDGDVLKEGVKYLLRTDIVFQRDTPFNFDILYPNSNKEEKGRKALEIAQQLEDGGNREDAVAWYRKAFKLNPALEGGG